MSVQEAFRVLRHILVIWWRSLGERVLELGGARAAERPPHARPDNVTFTTPPMKSIRRFGSRLLLCQPMQMEIEFHHQ